MAHRGVDAVSLREINAAAGQRNASAVQYHFSNRAGLLEALVGRHMDGVDATRRRLLAELPPEARDDPRQLVTVLVRPLTEKLEDESGRAYLRIVRQLADRAIGEDATMQITEINPSLAKTTALLAKSLAGLPPKVRGARVAHSVRFLLDALAVQAREIDEGVDPRRCMPNDLFEANLVDELVAVVTAKPSTATAALRKA